MKKGPFHTFLFLFLILGILASRGWAAPFQNGDFETGDFTGWLGEVLFMPVDPDTDPAFDILSNTGPDNSDVAQVSVDDNDWLADLYQEFTLDSLAPGETMDITFWIDWDPSSETLDQFSVTLEDLGGTTSMDLLDGISLSDQVSGTWVTQDITSFAQSYGGQDVTLDFAISTIDDQADFLKIDDITLERHGASPVPEPATMTLLGLGLAGMGMTGLRRRRRERA